MLTLFRHLNIKKYNLNYIHSDQIINNVKNDKVSLKPVKNNQHVSTDDKNKHMVTVEEIEIGNKNDADSLPEEPTTCCMSGCANCVWLEYADKLSEYYKDGGEKAIKEINESISDNNVKAFLLHEIRMRQK